MKNDQCRFESKGNQCSHIENKPQHHKVNSEPYLLTNSSNFAFHKIKIFPREKKKMNFYPLIIKNKRIQNTNDLYSKIQDSHQYRIYTKKQIEINDKLDTKKSRNFRLITESTTSFKLPPIIKPNGYHNHNRNSNEKKPNLNTDKGRKSIKEFNDDYFDLGKQNRNQMLDVLLKDIFKPGYHYQFPIEYEKIKINNKTKLYKNKLTIPTHSDIDIDQYQYQSNHTAEEIELIIQLRSQRYRNTYIKPKKDTPIAKPKKTVMTIDNKTKEKQLKKINDSFIQKYQEKTKRIFKSEIDSAIYKKELLSNDIDLILKRDAEEFNKIELDSADDY